MDILPNMGSEVAGLNPQVHGNSCDGAQSVLETFCPVTLVRGSTPKLCLFYFF